MFLEQQINILEKMKKKNCNDIPFLIKYADLVSIRDFFQKYIYKKKSLTDSKLLNSSIFS